IFPKSKSIKLNTDKENVLYSTISVILISIFSVGVLNNPWSFPIMFTVVVLGAILIIKRINVMNSKTDLIIFVTPGLLSIIFAAHVLMHLPIKDFRPYAEGENILEGIAAFDPQAVDVNSGVETAPGLKDPVKMEHLFSTLAQTQASHDPIF
ncbi:MAG: hypothetical protein IID14_06050, partial [Candidatus Marinimicrobia bacterium]|nr:hypothetical protein [Candidatus Neomarinimicrobiota bacterium]